MEQLSDALTELHNNDALWVGVISAEGNDFTAGLDMPKFFGPNAEKRNLKEGNVDLFGLQQALPQTDRHRRARHRVHDRHRDDAGRRHRRCRRRQPLLPDGIQTRHCAAWRCTFPFPLPHGLGQRDVSFNAVRRVRVRRGPARSAWCRRWCPPAGRSSAPLELAAIIANNAPLGIQVTKEAAAKYIEDGEAAAIGYIPAIRDRVLHSADAREGIHSFIERRAAVFQGT